MSLPFGDAVHGHLIGVAAHQVILDPRRSLEFEDRGAHTLKGVPGEWHLFAVES